MCKRKGQLWGERNILVARSGAEFVPDTVVLERIVLAAEGC